METSKSYLFVIFTNDCYFFVSAYLTSMKEVQLFFEECTDKIPALRYAASGMTIGYEVELGCKRVCNYHNFLNLIYEQGQSIGNA